MTGASLGRFERGLRLEPSLLSGGGLARDRGESGVGAGDLRRLAAALVEPRIGKPCLKGGAFSGELSDHPFRLRDLAAQRRERGARLGTGAAILSPRPAALRPRLRARPLGEQSAVVVEVALEGRDGAVGDKPEAIGHKLDQVRVVADQHHRSGIRGECAYQPLAGIDVEMVGRLVEDQKPR